MIQVEGQSGPPVEIFIRRPDFDWSGWGRYGMRMTVRIANVELLART